MDAVGVYERLPRTYIGAWWRLAIVRTGMFKLQG